MKKILIGSNGGLTGIYLAKNLNESGEYILYGADSNSVNCGKFFVKEQFILPKADDKKFVDRLIHLLDFYDIDFYLPTHSNEIEVVSKYEKKIRENTHTKFIVSPADTYISLDDKVECNRKLSGIGVPVPNLISGYDHPYPIFMKKRKGSGGSGAGIIMTEEIQKAYAQESDGYAFFEFIDGEEYTCDCLFDYKGKLIGSHARRRVKTIGGAVSITESAFENIGLSLILRIADKWKMCGCVNFQYIVKDNTPYFTDINLRYPSGGLPLTVAAGFDIPRLVLQLLEGKKIEQVKLQDAKLRMYRYFEEIFEDML